VGGFVKRGIRCSTQQKAGGLAAATSSTHGPSIVFRQDSRLPPGRGLPFVDGDEGESLGVEGERFPETANAWSSSRGSPKPAHRINNRLL